LSAQIDVCVAWPLNHKK